MLVTIHIIILVNDVPYKNSTLIFTMNIKSLRILQCTTPLTFISYRKEENDLIQNFRHIIFQLSQTKVPDLKFRFEIEPHPLHGTIVINLEKGGPLNPYNKGST